MERKNLDNLKTHKGGGGVGKRERVVYLPSIQEQISKQREAEKKSAGVEEGMDKLRRLF